MERTILKLDCTDFDGARSAADIERAIDRAGDPAVVVTSIFRGADRALAEAAKLCAAGDSAVATLGLIREGHLAIVRALGAPLFAEEAACLRIESLVRKLRSRLADPGLDTEAEVLALGSRLSATCAALALAARGRPAALVEPKDLAGGYSSLGRFPSSVLPGDFSVDAGGRTVILGRDGPATVAAAVAAELGAAVVDSATIPFRSAASAFRPGATLRSAPRYAPRLARNPGVA